MSIINQSINQPTNQTVRQSVNQSINQSINLGIQPTPDGSKARPRKPTHMQIPAAPFHSVLAPRGSCQIPTRPPTTTTPNASHAPTIPKIPRARRGNYLHYSRNVVLKVFVLKKGGCKKEYCANFAKERARDRDPYDKTPNTVCTRPLVKNRDPLGKTRRKDVSGISSVQRPSPTLLCTRAQGAMPLYAWCECCCGMPACGGMGYPLRCCWAT